MTIPFVLSHAVASFALVLSHAMASFALVLGIINFLLNSFPSLKLLGSYKHKFCCWKTLSLTHIFLNDSYLSLCIYMYIGSILSFLFIYLNLFYLVISPILYDLLYFLVHFNIDSRGMNLY